MACVAIEGRGVGTMSPRQTKMGTHSPGAARRGRDAPLHAEASPTDMFGERTVSPYTDVAKAQWRPRRKPAADPTGIAVNS